MPNRLIKKISATLSGTSNAETFDIYDDSAFHADDLVNNVSNTSTGNPLDSYQGKVLNDKISDEISTRQNTCQELASNISSEVTARSNAINTLTARMDTFTSLPSGSTSANAELTDIRIKADGSKAGSAGSAVREQVRTLTEAINGVNEGLSSSCHVIDNDDGYAVLDVGGLTLGKSFESGGQYVNAAYGYYNLRAASPVYFASGNSIKVTVSSGYKVEIDFYNETHAFVSYVGWITGTRTLKPAGPYFRVLVAGDSTIENVYKTIATIRVKSNVSVFASIEKSLHKSFGGDVVLDEWITGKFPNYSAGAIWDSEEYKYAPKVRIIGGAKYHYTGVFNSVCGAIFYDKNGLLIDGAGTNENDFTAPLTAYYADIGTRYLSTNAELYCVGSEWNIEENISTAGEILETTEQTGAITPSLTPNPDTGARVDLRVTEHECYEISGYTYVLNTYPLVIFLNNDTLIGYDNAVSSAGASKDYKVYVPGGANRMIVNGKPKEIVVKRVVTTVRDAVINSYNRDKVLFNSDGKTIVWFGTSIPANGWFGYEHPQAYPQQVGRLLNANVINEAIGSSAIHCKDPARITTANPYGFNTNFEASSRCLTNTQAEMDWICNNWNSSIWTSGKPDSMTDWLKGVIHGFGYEQKLDKYLTADTFPDLFVFDHGFNDSSDTNNYYQTYGQYSLYTFRGGMNFLIKRILDYNPYANIVIIGNYTTTRDVPEMQTAVAEDWSIPIYKQWETLGLTLTENVSAYGHWELVSGSTYSWVTDSTATTYSMRDRMVPDHVHPWSNPTGKVTKKMAYGIAKWLVSTNVLFDN